MKKSTHILALLAGAALALSGCVKPSWTSGKAVRFGAGTKGGELTKTSYGEFVGESPNKKQMIDWVAGDMIRIVCAQASTAEGAPTSADYVTTAGVRYGTSAESRATLSLASHNDKGLRWGSTTAAHKFYAVYPSPKVKNGTSLTDAGAFTGIIPASQTVKSISGSSPSFVAAPDMTNQYMVARKTVAAGTQEIGEEEVFLNFTPIITAIEFEITNKMTGALAISSIELISNVATPASGKKLSGTFSASLAGLNENGLYPDNTYPAFTAGTGAANSAKVVFTGLELADDAISLAVGDKLTFTVFLLPESKLDDLTFRINKLGGGYIQTALKSDASTWIGFDRCKKHFVKGLMAKEGAKWTLVSDPDVDPWDDSTADIGTNLNDPALGILPSLINWESGEISDIDLTESPEFVFTFGDGTGETTQTFSGDLAATGRSRTVEITSTKGEAAQTWNIKTVDGNDVTDNSYTIDDQLKVTKGTDGKLAIEDLRLKISYGDNAHWTTSGTDWYRAPLSGTTDLSKRDFRTGNSTSMRTANCYVVRNAGTYQIPLVYGNAIDYSKTGLTDGKNTQSYAPDIASGGSNGLTPFVNHLGNGIFDPYIENNTLSGVKKVAKDATSYLKAAEAVILWTDAPGVITLGGTKGIAEAGKTVVPNGNNKGLYTDGEYDEEDVRHIQFSVSNTNIRQCNALIAVKDADNNIMWSWHIWVTNNPALGEQAIAVTNYAGNTSSFLAVPAIGWIDPDFYEQKDDVIIVLEQEDSGEQITVTVKQQEYLFDGTSPGYQFGRKDPIPAKDVTGTFRTVASQVEPETSILNPDVFYSNGGVDWLDDSNIYYNLWTGKESKSYTADNIGGNAEENDNMIKTVYDPSPAGYKVPSVKAFTGFTTTGNRSGSKSDINAEVSYHKGWDFYTNPTKSSTIYFPAICYRSSNGTLHSPSTFGRYRTSTNDQTLIGGKTAYHSFEFQFCSSYVYPMVESSGKANAFPLRPIAITE